jgi:Protein of unknown function (DUF4019)
VEDLEPARCENGGLFENAVSRDEWTRALHEVRGPRGRRVSRTFKSRQHSEKLPGPPDLRDVVRRDTVLANKASATETITPMVDEDRACFVSGSFIQGWRS